MANKFIPISIQLLLTDAKAQIAQLRSQIGSVGQATTTVFSGQAQAGAKAFDQSLKDVAKDAAEAKKALADLEQQAKLKNFLARPAETTATSKKGSSKQSDNAEKAINSSFNAFASLGRGDVGGFVKNLSNVRSELSAATTAAGAFGTSLLGIGVAGGAIAGVALGAVAITSQFVEMAKEGSEVAGRMLDLSLNTGIAAESLSRYKIQAEQSGSSVGAVASSIELLERRLQEATSGNKGLNGLFKAVGIDAKKAGEDPQAAFEKLADVVGGIEDPVLRVKLATELLGRGGANLISTFVTMREDGNALKQRMAELGLTLTDKVAKSADSVGDEFVILGAVSDSLKVKVANELAPQLVNGLTSIEKSLVKIEPFIVDVGAAFIKQLGPAVGVASLLADAIDRIYKPRATPGAFDPKSAAGQLAIQAQASAAATGRPIDENSGLPRLFPPNKKPEESDTVKSIRAAIAALNKGKGGGGLNTELSANLAQQKAFAEETLRLQKDQANRELAALKGLFDDGLIEASNYYKTRFQITQGGIAQELDALQKEQAQLQTGLEKVRGKKPGDNAKRTGIETDLNKNLGNQILKQRELTSAVNEETEGLKKVNNELLKSVALQPEQISLASSTAEEFSKLPPIFQDIRTKIEDATKATQQFDSLQSQLRIGEEEVQGAVARGLIDEAEGRERTIFLQRQYRDGLLAELAIKREAAALRDGNEREVANIDEQIASIRNLGAELTQTEALQLRFSQQGVVNYKKVNQSVAEYLASQKGLTESFADFRINTVKTVFDGLDSGIDKLTEGLGKAGEGVRGLIKDLVRLAATKLFEKLFGVNQQAGPQLGIAGANRGGGGFNPLSLLTGGGGGNGGGGSFLTGGFAGGNPAQAAISSGGSGSGSGGGLFNSIIGGGRQQGGGGLSGLLGKIPGLGKLFGGGAASAGSPALSGLGANIGGLPGVAQFGQLPLRGPGVGEFAASGLSKAAAAPGAFASLGAGGLLAGGGLLGSLAGGSSSTGKLLGGLGGTLGLGALGATGIFGSGVAAALPALFSNPITAIVAGGLIGGALLFKFFADRTFNKFRKEVKGAYQIEVDKKEAGRGLFKGVEEIGKRDVGKDWKNKIPEVIQLKSVKDQIAQYGLATNQTNSPLVQRYKAKTELTDPNDDRNNFIKREFGGPIVPGAATLVGERRPEIAVFGQSGEIFPSIAQFERQLIAALQQRAAAGGFFSSGFNSIANQLTARAAGSGAGIGQASLGSGGGNDMLMAVLSELAAGVQNLQSFKPGDVVGRGLAANPEAASAALERSARAGSSSFKTVQRLVIA